jgi:valyl-tRNA synthetase
VIEPYLTEQWFVKMNDLVSPAIEAVHSGLIRFIPEHWSKNYLQWLNNIADWCISRQLWWGHRIPVWYDAEGNHYAGHNEAEVRQHYQLSATLPLRQETDVLDTWFSSSLWPFAALGWPQDTVDFNRFFPSQVLVTGFDIIFFWVARMIMMSLKFTGQVPFAEVYITGLILDESGQKMSKTKGNVLDPLDLIDGIDLAALINKRTANLMQPDMASAISNNTRSQFPDGIKAYGSDALRLSFAAIASHAREINFDMSKLASCRNFCNKLWNAARFVLMHSSDDNTPVIISQQAMTDLMLTMPSNRWIISLLQQTIQHTNAALTAYRFDLLVNTLYEFTWNEFCDWYVEIAKIYLGTTTGTAINKRAVQYTLLFVLEILLRLLHPVIPFITAEIWQQVAQLLGKSSPNIMVAEYPEYCVSLIDNQAVAELSWVKEIVTAIRTIRSTINVSPKRLLTLIIKGGTPDGHGLVVRHEQLLKKLANLSEITCLNSSNTNQQQLNNSYVASAVVHDMELFIPLNQIVDYAVELAKLKKNISKLQQEYDQLSCKLADKSFTDNAPQAIVLKVQERLLKLSKNIHHQEAQVLQLTNSINC